jgi:hypothetical protein
MKSAKVCPYCEGNIDLPHRTDDDCFRMLDGEIKATLAYLRSLTKRKGKLLGQRVQSRQRAVAASRRRRAVSRSR